MSSGSGIEEAIRRKLLIDGEGMGDDRRFSSLLKLTLKLFGPEINAENSQVCQGKIRSLLDQCELTMRKSRLVHRMNVKEMERYGHLSKDFEAQITGAERKIERSKEELAEARQIRRHRQEYDAIAHVIKEKPERRETLKKIADLKAKLGESRALKSELSAKIDLRKKQFHVVMVSLDELSRLIAAEETKEKSAPSGTASVAPSEDGSSEAPMEQQNC